MEPPLRRSFQQQPPAQHVRAAAAVGDGQVRAAATTPAGIVGKRVGRTVLALRLLRDERGSCLLLFMFSFTRRRMYVPFPFDFHFPQLPRQRARGGLGEGDQGAHRRRCPRGQRQVRPAALPPRWSACSSRKVKTAACLTAAAVRSRKSVSQSAAAVHHFHSLFARSGRGGPRWKRGDINAGADALLQQIATRRTQLYSTYGYIFSPPPSIGGAGAKAGGGGGGGGAQQQQKMQELSGKGGAS